MTTQKLQKIVVGGKKIFNSLAALHPCTFQCKFRLTPIYPFPKHDLNSMIQIIKRIMIKKRKEIIHSRNTIIFTPLNTILPIQRSCAISRWYFRGFIDRNKRNRVIISKISLPQSHHFHYFPNMFFFILISHILQLRNYFKHIQRYTNYIHPFPSNTVKLTKIPYSIYFHIKSVLFLNQSMQEQTIPQKNKFANQRTDKQCTITMKLIEQTSLQARFKQQTSQEQKINTLLKTKSIHLQWMNIKLIQNLQVFTDLTILYLQHNKICKLEGLDHLMNLEYLAINDNHIAKVENLQMLKKLQGLNISNNQIEDFQAEELPENVQLINMRNNPVCLDADYKQKVLKRLKNLETFDDQIVTPAERFKLLGIFPEKLLGYAGQMRQFYTKRQVQARLKQQQKPILFNTQVVDEKQALGEMREKTRRYLHQNQESFKQEQKEAQQDFTQKIEVSRRIRSIKQKQELQRQQRLTRIRDTALSDLHSK